MCLKPTSYWTLCILLLSLGLGSCISNKKVAYFRDIPDSVYQSATNITSTPFYDPLIQPNDLLQVSILTLDPQANTILTAANSASFSIQTGSSNFPTGAMPSINGFLVDNKGIVELPVIGKIKVAGLTTAAARDSIHARVSEYYKNPVVNVRFANFNITVLGEVTHPATYVVPSEKVSVLDALGMAGDLTIYGKRENVLLIRDSMGVKQYVRFNLNSVKMLSSPYLYLRQGDVIYVEPSKTKVAATDNVRTRNIALIASGISLLFVVFSNL